MRLCFVILVYKLCHMNKFIDIGNEIAEYSKKVEFTAQRGLVDELFPFIYVASKRMSLRAITRWLEEHHDIQISINTVANAMRDQESYWAQLVEDVEPAARIVAEAYNLAPFEVLDRFDVFQCLETTTPCVAAQDAAGIEKELRQIAIALGMIRNRWFSLPEEVRIQCRRHFVGVFYNAEELKTEEHEDVRKKPTRRKTK